MNNHDLFRALGNIDDALLEECEQIPPKKKPVPYGRYVTVAVAACLCVGALFLFPHLLHNGASNNMAGADGMTQSVNPSEAENRPDIDVRTPTLAGGVQSPADAAVSGEMPPVSVESAGLPSNSYGTVPSDFEFTLTWEGDVYRSADLPPHLLQKAWELLSGLAASPSEVHGPIELTLTANGITGFAAADEAAPNADFSICAELQKLFETNHISPQSIR